MHSQKYSRKTSDRDYRLRGCEELIEDIDGMIIEFGETKIIWSIGTRSELLMEPVHDLTAAADDGIRADGHETYFHIDHEKYSE